MQPGHHAMWPHGARQYYRKRMGPHKNHAFVSHCLMASCLSESCPHRQMGGMNRFAANMKPCTDENGFLSLHCKECSKTTGGATYLQWCSGLRYVDIVPECPRGVRHVYFMGKHHPDCSTAVFTSNATMQGLVEVRSPGNIAHARGNVMNR